jgi:hypothetical protein
MLFAKGCVHLITGLLMLTISLLSFFSTRDSMKIMDKGKKVEAIVVESPTNCNNVKSRNGFCKLKYKQNLYNKGTKGQKYCHLVSGKETVLMFTNKAENKLLFPGEYEPGIFIYSFGMLLLAIWFFIKV